MFSIYVMTTTPISNILIYQASNGAIELKGDLDRETIRASQSQMAQIFDVSPQNITLHINNIYKEEELQEGITCKNSLQVQQEWSRQVKRKIKFYNLDVIIAVWYRISSVQWTKFRHTITPQALTSITLLIATSDPKDKQRLIDLVMLLLGWK